MYGLVNKAVEDLVCNNFGEDAWEAIKSKAGVDIDMFIGMEAYPDEITYKLVFAASEVLKLPADQILHAFGEHWILYTAKEGYGDLLQMNGNTLHTFLENLNTMHARIRLSMPHLQPPTIYCSDVQHNSLRLHYHSTRPGLAPMVVGLLHGLGKMFATPVEITQLTSREAGADHEEFLVQIKHVVAA